MKINEEIQRDFDAFDPADYLKEYYTQIDFENEQLLQFFSQCYKDVDAKSTLLEFGSGPTLYSLITAASKVAEIHICDRLATNLHEIQRWKKGHKEAFNWEFFIQRALEIEGNNRVTLEDIQKRSELLKEKMTLFCSCDAFSNPPLPTHQNNRYDIIQVNFVPESITSSFTQWENAMLNILSLLKPQGTFILTALKNASYYHLQEKRFPATNIDEHRLKQFLTKFGDGRACIRLQTIPANLPYRGYNGMIFVKAQFFKNS